MSVGQVGNPGIVGPSPVPQSVFVEVAELNGTRLVLIKVASPTGLFTMFLPPDDADRIADAITTAAVNARSRLTLARAVPPTP